MSIDLDLCCTTVSVIMLLVIILSNVIGVGPWIWPISCRALRRSIASLTLIKPDPSFRFLNRGHDSINDFFSWIELVHWFLVEYHLVWLLVWVCHKYRRNHRCKSEIWIHWNNRHVRESISAFGLNDIEFWHWVEWPHSQEIDLFVIWDPSMSWLKGRRWWRWRLFTWCYQCLEHNI